MDRSWPSLRIALSLFLFEHHDTIDICERRWTLNTCEQVTDVTSEGVCTSAHLKFGRE